MEEAVLRIHGHGECAVYDVRKFLERLEDAYYSCYLLDEISSGYYVIPSPDIMRMPKSQHLEIWRRKKAQIAIEHRLVLKSVSINSPGAWEFLGKLNPFQSLLQYLNDRHKDQWGQTRLIFTKMHDWSNSWSYNTANGFYMSRGTGFDSIFQAYSFAGMPVAGALTAVSYLGDAPYGQVVVDSFSRRRR